MAINDQLESLYAKYFDKFIKVRSSMGEQSSSFPLLLKVNEDEWLESPLKIIIFGQETRGWGKNQDNNSVQSLMDTYERFYYKKSNSKARNKTFFKGVDRVVKCIKSQPGYDGQKSAVIWNNINKIGKYSGTGVDSITRKIERISFQVIPEEIEILTPDLLVFFTGPHRDGDILYNFPNAIIQRRLTPAYGKRSIQGRYALIDGYPFKAIRLYHPASRGYCTNRYLQLTVQEWLSK